MLGRENVKVINKYLPDRIQRVINKISLDDIKNITEIRIRTGKPIYVTIWGESFCITQTGILTKKAENTVIATFFELNEILKALCHYSVHSMIKELAEGYITLEGGIRVGLAGTLSQTGEGLKTLKYINGVNFRIPRQVKGCGEYIYQKLLKKELNSVLICGEVSSGKTTLLRDLCRLCGNERIVTAVDERGELAGCSNGIPQNDIGLNTDILDGYPRADGIINAVRSLSPQVIVCDEIGTENDAIAMLKAVGCGVKFISTVHGTNYNDLMKREHIQKLINNGIFNYLVILEGMNSVGTVREIRRLE